MTALSFGKLEEAYIFVYENAKELLDESRLLFEHKNYARCYTLAQIAIEELAKLPIIYQEATRSFFKEPHDWKHFYKRLRSHEAKNRQNFVYFRTILDVTEGEHPDFEFNKLEQTLKYFNDMKNMSLYADVKNNKFTKPSMEIKQHTAKELLQLVEGMFEIFSLTGFQNKGGIKKSLDHEGARIKREIFRKAGLIK
ncbi:AbiV family abortive infection protein [Bacillus sp. FJAT-29814]|uniref:AbiV family abortive infection protein n=1 Tax=Bacillus sp. FJAT-29814 TaxID=1729688 RepID=UPI00082B6061|nr:AbiV family abortive infection protein [Bacillus sp. FJAT-29814]